MLGHKKYILAGKAIRTLAGKKGILFQSGVTKKYFFVF